MDVGLKLGLVILFAVIAVVCFMTLLPPNGRRQDGDCRTLTFIANLASCLFQDQVLERSRFVNQRRTQAMRTSLGRDRVAASTSYSVRASKMPRVGTHPLVRSVSTTLLTSNEFTRTAANFAGFFSNVLDAAARAES
jgi:hypothetical protein